MMRFLCKLGLHRLEHDLSPSFYWGAMLRSRCTSCPFFTIAFRQHPEDPWITLRRPSHSSLRSEIKQAAPPVRPFPTNRRQQYPNE